MHLATDLIVPNVDPELVRALEERAAQHGVSAVEEHREILTAVLRKPKRRPFNEVLMSMPNVGLDSDFERRRD